MTAEDAFDLAGFEHELDTSLNNIEAAFRGTYKEELEALAGLSQADIDAITPGTTDLETYEKLIAVVREASRVNLQQAELKRQITKLGDIAINIARRVPKLAAILA